MKRALRYGQSLFLFSIMFALAASVSFAAKKKGPAEAKDQEKIFRIEGRVDKVHKDHKFELVTDEGERYLIHAEKDVNMRLLSPSPSGRKFVDFDSLLKNQRVSVRVYPRDQALVTNTKP